jgi:hypothetical protein
VGDSPVSARVSHSSRRAWNGDAAPQESRLAPGAAVLIILLLSLALWAAMIWGAIALWGAING